MISSWLRLIACSTVLIVLVETGSQAGDESSGRGKTEGGAGATEAKLDRPEDPYADLEGFSVFCDGMAGALAELASGDNNKGRAKALGGVSDGLKGLSAELAQGDDNAKGIRLSAWTVRLRLDTLRKFDTSGCKPVVLRNLDWLYSTVDNWPGIEKPPKERSRDSKKATIIQDTATSGRKIAAATFCVEPTGQMQPCR